MKLCAKGNLLRDNPIPHLGSFFEGEEVFGLKVDTEYGRGVPPS